MATYTPEELSGQGTPTEALTAGTEYVFTLLSSNILLGSAYFTFETVRNANGFYDSTSPTNAVGTLASASGVQNPIQSPYIFSEVINSITSSFTFTPTENVAVSSSYLRTTGGVSLDITPSGPAVTPFQMTVDTTKTGTSSNTSMTIPFAAGTFTDCVVDWGDSTTTTVTTSGNVTHDYGTTNTAAVIQISGAFPGLIFANGGDKLKLITVDQWGTNVFTSMNQAFQGCTNFTGGFTDYPKFTTTSLFATFYNCTSFNADMDSWDMSGVTTMQYMFYQCSSFNQNLNSWDVSNVINFSGTFYQCTNFGLNGTGGNISSWDPSSCTTMNSMFRLCSNFNTNIDGWDVSNVTDMFSTFNSCTSFNQPLNSWNMTGVTTMQYMFYQCSSFNQNLNSWDVSDVVIMLDMFFSCINFAGDVSSWDTSSCTNMSSMFRLCRKFNSDIGGWDVSNVTTMNSMLNNCDLFDQDLGSWDVGSCTVFVNFMISKTPSTFSAANLDAIYNGWSSRTLQSGVTISFGTAKYNSTAQAGRDILTGGTNLWNITDGGVV